MTHFFSALLVLLLSGPALAQASLELWQHGQRQQTLTFPSSPLLSQALHAVPGEPYWPAVQISTPSRQQAMMGTKAQVLAELDELASWARQNSESDVVIAAEALRQQLSPLAMTGRFSLPVDPDLLRSRSHKDVLLQGHYRLFLAERRPELALFGLYRAAPSRQRLHPAAPLRDYWRSLSLLDGADPAYAYLVAPDGRVQKVAVALWNAQAVAPMPGSALYVGFSPEALPTRFHQLNERVLTLLANRMPE